MKFVILSVVLFLFAFKLSSQVDLNQLKLDETVSIVLLEGTEIKGKISGISKEVLQIESETLGLLKINVSEIKSIDKVGGVVVSDKKVGAYINTLPQKNFLTETAIGLEKGSGYYQNIMLGGHVFAYGISDNFSLGGGFEVFSLFAGSTPLFFISPKFTFPNENKNIHFGFGGNLALLPDNGSRAPVGTFYGITTFGSPDQNFTVGLGYAFSGGDISDQPIIQLGGMTKISKNLMLVADHVIGDIESTEIFGTWTLRYVNHNFSLDFGAVIDYNRDSFPVGSASIKF